MIRVAIIGAGKIAQGFDAPDASTTLTHVKAFQEHGGFEVVAFCDSDPARASEAATRWNVRGALSRVEDLKALAPDVVCICTPDRTHEALLEEVLALNPRLVFCEKPLATDFRRAEVVVERYRSADVPLAVNYSRRWLRALQEWKPQISKGAFGNLLSIRARYYGGWLHIGSHLVDMVQALCEPAVIGGVLLRRDAMGDDWRLDGSSLLDVQGRVIPFHFESLGGRVSHFELEMTYEHSSLWIGERGGSGFKVCPVLENPHYPGYFELNEGPLHRIDPSEAMRGAVENIFRHLSRGDVLYSTGTSALQTLKICEDIRSLASVTITWQN